MKNFIRLTLIGTIFVALFSSCENQLKEVEENTSSGTPADDMEMLKNMGFDISMVKDNGDTYIIDGDILIEKSELPLYGQVPQTRQAYYKYTVKSGKRSLIRVKIDSAVPAVWAEAAANAVAAWNGLGTEIEMSITTGSSYEIIVRKGSNFESGVVARAVYPSSSGNPGSYVEINDAYTSNGVEKLTYTMVHEFGHNLGFAHSDWSTSGNLTAHDLYEIQDTPSSMFNPDINSIMYSHSGNRRWDGCSFTDYDKIAARYVYSRVSPLLNISGYVNANAATNLPFTLTLSYNSRQTPYTVEWIMPSGVQCEYSNGNRRITLNFPTAGSYDIQYRVVQGMCGEWKTKTIKVYDLPADQWVISDLKVENGRASYRLAYNAVSANLFYPELWIQFLYRGTYDSSLYSGQTWQWHPQGAQYIIPPVLSQHGSSCLLSYAVSIPKGRVYVREVVYGNGHLIYSGYNESNIEIANIFGGEVGSTDFNSLYNQLIWIN